MKLNTVIFDMDGLLIDSEPLWKEAADSLLYTYGKKLTEKQYSITTGLRTKEFLEYWFGHFELPMQELRNAEIKIVADVIELVRQKGKPMPGMPHIFNLFMDKGFKIGLATSSSPELIEVVVDLLNIRMHLQAIASADDLPYGKPHPQVYLNCAAALNSSPLQCLCFEDSYNGMIAAKAAKMKCVVVPSIRDSKKPAWAAADLQISTLQNFNELLLNGF